MSESYGRTPSERLLIGAFDAQFARLHWCLIELIKRTREGMLYLELSETRGLSVGENVLRAAALVEQTFGGITANLWDDPFEWTLPENLSTNARVIEYLGEVEATRKRAFTAFKGDDDLSRQVRVPSGETQPIVTLLMETLVNAAGFQGRAEALQRRQANR